MAGFECRIVNGLMMVALYPDRARNLQSYISTLVGLRHRLHVTRPATLRSVHRAILHHAIPETRHGATIHKKQLQEVNARI
jgi:hypothetical protein